MGLLDRFKKKRVEEKGSEQKKGKDKAKTNVESLFGDDREVYEALRRTMFLDPRNLEVSLTEAEKRAKEFEKKGDKLRALTWYETAGRLAIYEGDAKSAKEYFSKSQKFPPNKKYPILKKTDDAIAKAREYYEKHLKD